MLFIQPPLTENTQRQAAAEHAKEYPRGQKTRATPAKSHCEEVVDSLVLSYSA